MCKWLYLAHQRRTTVRDHEGELRESRQEVGHTDNHQLKVGLSKNFCLVILFISSTRYGNLHMLIVLIRSMNLDIKYSNHYIQNLHPCTRWISVQAEILFFLCPHFSGGFLPKLSNAGSFTPLWCFHLPLGPFGHFAQKIGQNNSSSVTRPSIKIHRPLFTLQL